MVVSEAGLLPDWSAVRTDTARQALRAAFDAFDMGRRWAHLGAAEDRIRRAILNAYATKGASASASELSELTGLSRPKVIAALHRLRGRDLVVLGPGGRVVGAYPFSDDATGHSVRLGDRSLTAMCAIDALGVGAMFGLDTAIRSSCRLCGAGIEIETRERGHGLARAAPDSTVVWSGVQYTDSCAATSLCTVQTFFCSDEHLNAWRAPHANGFRLSIDEALQVGKAIFGPMLRASGEP
jgi:hypothetical protein